MKISALLLTFASLQVSARGYSQGISISLKNATLESVFHVIESQSDFSFVYSEEAMALSKPVSIQVKNDSLGNVLRICFYNQPLSYSIDGKFIIVRIRQDQSTITVLNKDVKGRILNELGEGVVATITEKGTTNATSSDADGYFLLKNTGDDATLVITGVNIETYEIKINGKSDLATIRVHTKVTEGGMIQLVSTGYQLVPRERATGSFATVDKEQFDNRISTDVISRLEGITSGLVFNKQGILGTPELSIRGRSTIFANDQPLIVVDNFPYDGDINNINPNDVENITVLKDAAAASIWGVRAGNGVIVITTKKGKFNQPLQVQLNTNVTVGAKPDLFYNPNFLNSSDFIDVEEFLFSKGYYDADAISTRQVPISPVVEILLKERSGSISSTDADAQINLLRTNDIRNDLSKYLYRKSLNQQNSLSISGGSERANYFFSAGYDKDLPNNIRSDYSRITLNTNDLFDLTKKLSLEIGINYVQSLTNQNEGGTSINTGGLDAKNIYPYAQLADANGDPLPIVKDYRQPFVQSAEGNGFLNWQYVPLNDLGLQTKRTNLFDTRINAGIKYNFFADLSGEVKYQYERFVTQEHDLAQSGSYYTRNLINEYATVNSSGTVTQLANIPLGGILDLSNAEQQSNNIRGQLNFNKSWGNSRIDAIAGAEVREIVGNTNSNRLYGYDDNLSTFQAVAQPTTAFILYPTGNSSTIPSLTDVGGGTDRFRSYFSDIAYTFKDRYTFSASGRIDQSNFFGVKTNQRSVPLWSAGGKWSISKEHFYHIHWLPHLALRITYGYNGNLDRTVTAITTFSYFSTGAILTGAKYANISNIGNPDLRWEKTGMFNAGIDFEFLKNILSGSIEYFLKRGVDLMGDAPLPPSSGVTQLRGNFANMSGRGVDVQLNSININKRFKWQTSLLFSYATDKVTRYDIGFPPSNYFGANGNNYDKYPIVGYPLYSVFSLRWGGLDPLTGDPRGYHADTLTKDYTLLSSPSLGDLIYNGPARPVYSGGLTNTFSYKGFSLSVNISYKLGYYFVRSSINYNDLFSRWAGNRDFSNRWQNPGDEIKTNVPSLVYPASPNRDQFYSHSEILVDKGDHIRLQYINASYDLSRNAIKKLPVNNARFYFLINNIGILWRANKDKIDPDFPAPSNGNPITGIPLSISLSAGLKVDF